MCMCSPVCVLHKSPCTGRTPHAPRLACLHALSGLACLHACMLACMQGPFYAQALDIMTPDGEVPGGRSALLQALQQQYSTASLPVLLANTTAVQLRAIAAATGDSSLGAPPPPPPPPGKKKNYTGVGVGVGLGVGLGVPAVLLAVWLAVRCRQEQQVVKSVKQYRLQDECQMGQYGTSHSNSPYTPHSLLGQYASGGLQHAYSGTAPSPGSTTNPYAAAAAVQNATPLISTTSYGAQPPAVQPQQYIGNAAVQQYMPAATGAPGGTADVWGGGQYMSGAPASQIHHATYLPAIRTPQAAVSHPGTHPAAQNTLQPATSHSGPLPDPHHQQHQHPAQYAHSMQQGVVGSAAASPRAANTINTTVNHHNNSTFNHTFNNAAYVPTQRPPLPPHQSSAPAPVPIQLAGTQSTGASGNPSWFPGADGAGNGNYGVEGQMAAAGAGYGVNQSQNMGLSTLFPVPAARGPSPLGPQATYSASGSAQVNPSSSPQQPQLFVRQHSGPMPQPFARQNSGGAGGRGATVSAAGTGSAGGGVGGGSMGASLRTVGGLPPLPLGGTNLGQAAREREGGGGPGYASPARTPRGQGWV